MSTFNFCPRYVNSIESIALPKNPVTNIFKSKFFLKVDAIPPNTESNAAIIAIAKYPEYVYEIIGILIPINAPIKHPNTIAIIIISTSNIFYSVTTSCIYSISNSEFDLGMSTLFSISKLTFLPNVLDLSINPLPFRFNILDK